MWDEHELKYDQHNPFDICAATYTPIYVNMWDEHELKYDQHNPFDICAATYMQVSMWDEHEEKMTSIILLISVLLPIHLYTIMWDEHELKYDQHNPFDSCAATYTQVSMWEIWPA